MVIVAIGVKPNVEFLQGSGIKVNRGIVVDDYLRVTCSEPLQGKLRESISEEGVPPFGARLAEGGSSPDIYAAGDVAEVKDFLTGQPTTSAIWPNAVEQGRVAALNILGRPTPYEGAVSINCLNINGVPITGMGLTENEARQKLGEPLEILSHKNESFRGKLILKNNHVVGFQGIGLFRQTGFIWSLLKKRMDVSSFKDSLFTPKSRFSGTGMTAV
jgi:NAD(P)H-nitrite reductase large subunit